MQFGLECVEFRFGDAAGATDAGVVVAGAVGCSGTGWQSWEFFGRFGVVDELDSWFTFVGGVFWYGPGVGHRY